VLEALDKEGFQIHGIQTAKVRTPHRKGFEKHLVRLRRPTLDYAEEAPEIAVINSHDGSSSYQILAGLIRFICENGLFAGTKWGEVRIPHKGRNTVRDVIEGTYEVLETFETIVSNVNVMKKIPLLHAEQELLARSALTLRYEGREPPITTSTALEIHRKEDDAPTLWNTYNRLQENLTKGGQRGWARGVDGRMRRRVTRPLQGIDGSVSFNRALWQLTEEFAALKGVELPGPAFQS